MNFQRIPSYPGSCFPPPTPPGVSSSINQQISLMVNGTMDNVQPLGLCQRYLKFLVNKLIRRGTKPVTLGGRESVEVPIEAPSGNGSNSVLKPFSKSNGEIVVEFRHIEPIFKKNGDLAATKKTEAGNHHHQRGRSTATPVQGSAVRNRGEGNGSIVKDIVIIHHETISGSEVADNDTIIMAPPKPSLRPFLIKAPSNVDQKADDFIRRRKEAMRKVIIRHETSSGSEVADNETIIMAPPRPSLWPVLLKAPSNVDRKADDFIRSRKEAMRKHYNSS